jgi:hypothetical protein
MAIRLTDDDSGSSYRNNSGGGASGGGNRGDGNNKGALAIILLILFGFFKFPKTTLFLLAVAGTLFYFYGDPAWLGIDIKKGGNTEAKGCMVDKKLYDKVPVFERLDAATGDNDLPARASLEKYAPRRSSQGQQGSCVGWASAYAARTIVEAVETDGDPNKLIFSPAFLYNQIGLEGCQGTYTSRALEKMQNDGLLFLNKFPYDENSCARKPTQSELDEATNYKIKGYTRISKGGDIYDVDMLALKQNINRGGPIIIAMMVPSSFSYAAGKELWEPESGERDNIDGHGGHAMCVIGYDDTKFGGAVQIMNSWSDRWGKDGLIWVKYSDFSQFCREAYAVHPTSSKTIKPNVFHLKLGLWLRQGGDSGKYIELEETNEGVFENVAPLRKGESFKVAVNNSVDCYIYIFGMEATGESYQLFPYPKTSPYFGMTGTRLFPKDKSLTLDNVGNKDYMAIIASKTSLNPEQINNKINNNRNGSYSKRVNAAIGTQALRNVDWQVDSKGIQFEGDTQGKNALVMVFGINKQ